MAVVSGMKWKSIFKVSWYTVLEVIKLPFILAGTVVEYYTWGTRYQRNREISGSLWKTLLVTAMTNLGKYIDLDIAEVINKPLPDIMRKFEKNPMVQPILEHYSEQYTEHSYWLVRNGTETSEKEDVLMYIHGGGYMVSILDLQFTGLLAFYYAIPAEKREKLSILIIDYSLTTEEQRFPTQIQECLEAYKKLVDDGYKKIHLIGDSAGGNMLLAISRFTAYPKEAEMHFLQFAESGFDFNFGSLPQPASLILISPWTDPLTKVNHNRYGLFNGDFVSHYQTTGLNYVRGLNAKELGKWVTFTGGNYEEMWSKVEALNGVKESLVIWGEVENSRESIEKWIDVVSQGPNRLACFMEEAGLHDALFYVESIDYESKKGAQKALNGEFDNKYAMNCAAAFICRQL